MRSKREPTCLALWPAAFLMLCCGTLAIAQEQPELANFTDQEPAAASQGNSVPDPSDAWHAALTMYLWFPGVHGTLGNGVRNVDFRASPGDLLSNFRFGLMGAVQVQRGRFVLISDLVWVRLRSTNTTTLPFPGVPTLSAEAKAWQLIVTPEFGYRFVDGEKVKVDALMGLRYWHVGSSLQFTPSPL